MGAQLNFLHPIVNIVDYGQLKEDYFVRFERTEDFTFSQKIIGTTHQIVAKNSEVQPFLASIIEYSKLQIADMDKLLLEEITINDGEIEKVLSFSKMFPVPNLLDWQMKCCDYYAVHPNDLKLICYLYKKVI